MNARTHLHNYRSDCRNCSIAASVHYSEWEDLWAERSCYNYVPSDNLEYLEYRNEEYNTSRNAR